LVCDLPLAGRPTGHYTQAIFRQEIEFYDGIFFDRRSEAEQVFDCRVHFLFNPPTGLQTKFR
jgi:hypothetical protein